MAENPPLNRLYVAGYAANDRDYPIVSMNLDPRVAGYKVPEDLSTCPDKRYPNHVFTGAQPLSGDERVRHVWEILPSPWVPFTRYDDDLGPIQGRRRSVKNEGQVASLTADKRTTYEAREGSAIVYTELEETWSIKVDEDGNSLFPIRDRDFYDASRGPVQERRQLFVPTGEEEGSLENVNGVITQTSYEPYNEFLSVKIVQTYKVNGPQLIGKATDNDGQLVTVTTQRKGADGYIPPNPTATRTVEVSREDAESLVERIVDTPEVFKANTFSVERPDPIPQKFRVAVPIQSSQEIVEGTAVTPTLEEGEISKTEEQRNKFIKRISATSRDETRLPLTLTQKATNQEKQLVTIIETLQQGDANKQPSATIDIQSEAIGDGKYIVTETQTPEVFKALTFRVEKADLTPQKFRAKQFDKTKEETVAGDVEEPSLGENEFAKTEQQINKFIKRVITTERDTDVSEELNEVVVTPEGQRATRTITLSNGAQDIAPSATVIDGNVEALGDGRTVKTEIKVDRVFDEKQESLEKPEIIPPEFRASLQNKTISEVKEGQSIGVTSLSGDEISKTQQRITEHKIRETKVIRPHSSYPALQDQLVDNDLIKIVRTRTISKGGQNIVPSATVSGTIEAIGDGYTLKTEDTKAKVFEARTFSQERPDNIPVEFRAEKPASTEEHNEAGNASTVSLSDTEIAKSEQQVNEFVKRIRKTTRENVANVTLIEQQIDPDGVKVNVEKSLSKGSQQIAHSATVRGQVQNLGGGYTVKTELTREEVLKLPLFGIEKPDVVPAAFRSKIQTTTREETVEGDADEPVLSLGDISKTERQIDKFLKRTTTVSRPPTVSETLIGSQIENDGIKSTVTRTLSSGPQQIFPSATVSGNVEDIGDGLTIKTEITKEKTFDAKSLSKSKPDTLPVRFRAAAPTQTEQKISEKTDAEEPDLSIGEIEKTEERITEFQVRETKVWRDNDSIPQLDGVDYEEAFDIRIPYTERIGNQIPADGSLEAEPLDDEKYLIREYSKQNIEQYLSQFVQSYPTTISLDLPRVLRDIRVEWDEKTQTGSYENTPFAAGILYQFANSDRGEASTSSSATPIVSLDFDDVWSKNIPATVMIFFLQNPITESDILAKTGANPWPVFKPTSHVITGKGVELRSSVSVGASLTIQQPKPGEFGGYSDQSRQKELSRSITPVIVNIPPCLHGPFNINEERNIVAEIQATARTASYGNIGSLVSTMTATEQDVASIRINIAATAPQDIPRNGKYLIDASVDFFKYGFSIVRATVFDASNLA